MCLRLRVNDLLYQQAIPCIDIKFNGNVALRQGLTIEVETLSEPYFDCDHRHLCSANGRCR